MMMMSWWWVKGAGYVAAVAVSGGSVALISRQLHHRLVNDFMSQLQFHLLPSPSPPPPRPKPKTGKRVRFADDVVARDELKQNAAAAAGGRSAEAWSTGNVSAAVTMKPF
ncbi:unnamed protein product [Linum trigynum]